VSPFSGAVAVVAGGRSGIGRSVCAYRRSVCAYLGRRGGVVVVVDRDLDAAHRTGRLVVAGGGQAQAMVADVAREEEVRAVADKSVEQIWNEIHEARQSGGSSWAVAVTRHRTETRDGTTPDR
jgi:NAD(P)-dependent dehydrogenase (short-subunit alcohol dehydrogenase family)